MDLCVKIPLRKGLIKNMAVFVGPIDRTTVFPLMTIFPRRLLQNTTF